MVKFGPLFILFGVVINVAAFALVSGRNLPNKTSLWKTLSDCISPKSTRQATLVIISHNGASGVYPDCTDLSYNQAVEDGADYIDCSVQITSDRIPICLRSSINMNIPDIQPNHEIFTFNLTWNDIQTLQPEISASSREYNLVRNPAYRNAGQFLSLDDFLTFAKSKRLSGIVISIENAAYLAENMDMSITDAVRDALYKSGYNNQTSQEVIIQSTNKAVLTRLKNQSKHKCMYMVDVNTLGDVDDSFIKDIKSFADYIAITKESVRDFFADPKINTFVMTGEIDGVITDFPGTAAAYRRNKCLGPKLPPYMTPVQIRGRVQGIGVTQLPAAEAPYPILRGKMKPASHVPKKSKNSVIIAGVVVGAVLVIVVAMFGTYKMLSLRTRNRGNTDAAVKQPKQ